MSHSERPRVLRKKETWAEKLMWRWLRDRRFSTYKFRRQHSVGIYYLDFFCDEAMLAIELDGLGHGHPDRQRHDAEREAFLVSRGVKVLRYWNSSLRRDAENIRETIFRTLQQRAPHPLPDYTRPTKLQEPNRSEAKAGKKVRRTLALTPALSPEERENRCPFLRETDAPLKRSPRGGDDRGALELSKHGRKLDEHSPSPRPSPPRRGRIGVRSVTKQTRL